MDTLPAISWYPGHMAQAKRKIREALRLVDGVIEVIDARLPAGSRNPDLQELLARRPHLLVATKADLADSERTSAWLAHWRSQSHPALAVSLEAPQEARSLVLREMDRLLGDRTKRAARRWMIVGIPNVGKSTLINALIGAGRARTGAKPGVTRGTQWIRLARGHHLLDTPGILWPKLDPPELGLHLAWIGSVGENALDTEEVAKHLLDYLLQHHPNALSERYGIDTTVPHDDPMAVIAQRRGMLLRGGVVDTERVSAMLLKEFRTGLLGRITLEAPPSADTEEGTDHGGEPM